MSRYNLIIPYTTEIRLILDKKFDIRHTDFPIYAAWGFDAPTGGYFFQLWVEPDDEEDDIYLEDGLGLIGSSNSRILNQLEKYGLTSIIKEQSLEHYKLLCLDFPF